MKTTNRVCAVAATVRDTVQACSDAELTAIETTQGAGVSLRIDATGINLNQRLNKQNGVCNGRIGVIDQKSDLRQYSEYFTVKNAKTRILNRCAAPWLFLRSLSGRQQDSLESRQQHLPIPAPD